VKRVSIPSQTTGTSVASDYKSGIGRYGKNLSQGAPATGFWQDVFQS